MFRYQSHRPSGVRRRALRTAILLGSVVLGTTRCGSPKPSEPPPAAVRIVLTPEAHTAIAGSAITPGLVARVLDAEGALVAEPAVTITVALAPGSGPGGAVLGGTVSRPTVNGIATFPDLVLEKAGTGYVLSATAPGLQSSASTPFDVVPGAAARLMFVAQPGTVVSGFYLVPEVRVGVQDAFGNPISRAFVPVTLTVSTGATLAGTATRSSGNGVAVFDDIRISGPGGGYTLTASATGLASATSLSFAVTPWSGTATSITLQSDFGDFIGAGQSYGYTAANADITVTEINGEVSVGVRGDQSWNARFQGPSQLTALVPGTYAGLTRLLSQNPTLGALSWGGEGRGCNTLTGSFIVDAVQRQGTLLTGIDLRFEQHCEGAVAALRGTIHWDLGDPTTPPGPVHPAPPGLWEPVAGALPPSGDVVYLSGEPGAAIFGGATATYVAGNSILNVQSAVGRVSLQVAGWLGEFQAMHSIGQLQPGYYPGLMRFPTHNPTKGGLMWFGQGIGCNALTGWFVVDAVSYSGSTLTGITLRFAQHCNGEVPALHGYVRWGG